MIKLSLSLIFYIFLTGSFSFLYAKEKEPEKFQKVEKTDKEKLIAEIAKRYTWFHEEHKNYIFLSNYFDKKLNKDFSERLAFYEYVVEQYYPKGKSNNLKVIRVINNQQDYVKMLAEHVEINDSREDKTKEEKLSSLVESESYHKKGLVMHWVPNCQEALLLICKELPRGKRYKDKLIFWTKQIGFSIYTFSQTAYPSTAFWFSEGNRMFFAGIERKGSDNGYTINYDSRMVKQFKKSYMLRRRKIPFKATDVLTLKNSCYFQAWHIDGNDVQAWALMYYLQKGAPSSKKYEYSLIPLKYMQAVRNGTDPAKATDVAWEGTDRKKFEADFQKFWKDKRLIGSSKGYDPIKDRKLQKIKTDFFNKETEK